MVKKKLWGSINMPYIPKSQRELFDTLSTKPTIAGELNYLITRECDDFISRRGLSYANINEVMGALECAKLEFYRRVAAPYEDRKARENGEVYLNGK